MLIAPHKVMTGAGLALAVWLIAGALTETAERLRLGRIPAAESLRRLVSLPRGAWGMSLAHIGLGVFLLGASVDGPGKIEAAKVMQAGDVLQAGRYALTLKSVDQREGPNYQAEHAVFVVAKAGAPACTAEPERRFYPAGGQTTSKVALCLQGVSDVYVVLGDTRPAAAGAPAWLVKVYWNPWARLIFLGPLIMALGGVVSLSDRRLRLGLPKRAARPAALEAAE
jgi:cytochrome c-type biogenesis protein CcmF